MNYIQAVILSLVEGLTEFLPISSTGHMILTSDLLKILQTEFVKSFEIIIQLGSILAVFFLYWKTLWKKKDQWLKLFVAFLPTAILGFAFYKFIKQYLLGNTIIVLLALFLGGIILIIMELSYKEEKNRIDKIEDISMKNAFLIGLFQSVSMIPGVSRSAATIFGGLFLGLKRKTAVEYSFLLAIPTMFAATGLDLIKSSYSFSGNDIKLLTIGFIGSFITAFLAVKFFVQYIKKHNFIPFAVYRIILAVLFFIFILK